MSSSSWVAEAIRGRWVWAWWTIIVCVVIWSIPSYDVCDKEPKWFLRDWSGLADEGARAETFVACHLLKAVEGWTDLGFGEFELRYLRDKMKREVDFLVLRDRRPWFLVEAKLNETALSPALAHFQAQTKAAHAFQVVLGLPFEPVDCFSANGPAVVPARTFLSQLL